MDTKRKERSRISIRLSMVILFAVMIPIFNENIIESLKSLNLGLLLLVPNPHMIVMCIWEQYTKITCKSFGYLVLLLHCPSMTCARYLIVSLASSQMESELVLRIHELHKTKMSIVRSGATNEIVELEGEGVI